jgi:hypothetical protein
VIILLGVIRKKSENKNQNLLKNICFNSRKEARENRFIVTLTSYGKRLKDKAPYAIASLMKQNVQPDKIILWLEYGTIIPKSIKKLTEYGLEIKFCEDIKSYKKLVPALLEFPDNVLVTADDDVFYPACWFNMLKESYLREPWKIHCHRAHEIVFDKNKDIVPYNEWRQIIRTIENNRRIFPTGSGGILYPPGSLHGNVVNKKEFTELCPTGDDIWFWAMANLKRTEYILVENGIRSISGIGDNTDGLYNVNIAEYQNDKQIRRIIQKYPEIIRRII